MEDNGTVSAATDEIDPEALEQWIDSISIRARLAYSLLCIESACAKWGVDSETISATLAVFWQHTSSEHLDEWEDLARESLPCMQIHHDDYVKVQEWRYFAEDWDVSSISVSHAEALGRMFVLAFEVGSENLYGGFRSEQTAAPLRELLNVMRVSGLTLPDRSRVSLSGVEERNGWGALHPPEDYG